MEDLDKTGTPANDATNQTATGVEGRAKGAESLPDQTPPQPTHSQEEFIALQGKHDEAIRQMQAGHKGTIKEMQKQFRELESKAKEREDAAYLRQVEDAGGDVEAAKRFIAREAQITERERQIREREGEIEAKAKESDEGLKAIAAERLIKEFGLEPTARGELLKAQQPIEMENIALKMALEKSKTGQKPTTKVDSTVTSTKGVDWSKLSVRERLELALKDEEAKKTK